ncbi:copper-transporting P-type ATPase [bacterium BMS3Abin05]|nr:copper-transporting P-type ATPase [bacterium BMS3Abin05]GBE28757.1 copper-transporting P-type ATPase [bacterium BMS3Bbin03]HDL78233.1 YHS domain-containing protein [Bacteroidota bacterium]HDZ12189.1 YHS domain-containing protein [Bacteroidota bacterium]
MAKDLVCGMEVDETSPPAKITYKGKEYFFCTNMCKIKFEENPEKYLTLEDGERKNEMS